MTTQQFQERKFIFISLALVFGGLVIGVSLFTFYLIRRRRRNSRIPYFTSYSSNDVCITPTNFPTPNFTEKILVQPDMGIGKNTKEAKTTTLPKERSNLLRKTVTLREKRFYSKFNERQPSDPSQSPKPLRLNLSMKSRKPKRENWEISDVKNTSECTKCDEKENECKCLTSDRVLEKKWSSQYFSNFNTNNRNRQKKKIQIEKYYLSTASNRLKLYLLKNRLTAQHVDFQITKEFSSIPMNCQTKISVPGSAIKNRYHHILPNETTRVRLSDGRYINANYVNDIEGKSDKRIIATQGPMETTTDNFWRMVWECRTTNIVMILQKSEHHKCYKYFPESEKDIMKTDNNIRINLLHKWNVRLIQSDPDEIIYEQRILQLEKNNQKRYLTHYWFVHWPDHEAIDLQIKLQNELDTRLPSLSTTASSLASYSSSSQLSTCSNDQNIRLPDNGFLIYFNDVITQQTQSTSMPNELLKKYLTNTSFLMDNLNSIHLQQNKHILALYILLREIIQRRQMDHTTNLIVHCSAGIGRTGCFLALIHSLEDIEKQRVRNFLPCSHICNECRSLFVTNRTVFDIKLRRHTFTTYPPNQLDDDNYYVVNGSEICCRSCYLFNNSYCYDIDILKIVCQLRMCRGRMIENHEQYIFLYSALDFFYRNIYSKKQSRCIRLHTLQTNNHRCRLCSQTLTLSTKRKSTDIQIDNDFCKPNRRKCLSE
ncbi:hypothetical protein SNEBB_010145 [Seison nebaliae]|nr:hypothetical protein SNEBB_010145 [Seison nebaliae]